MKTQTILATLFISGLLFGLTACSKQDVKDNTSTATDATKNATDKAANAVKETGDAVSDAAKKTGDPVAEKTKETTEAVKTATANASADIMAALENAKKLVTEGKWQEAAKALEPLGSLKLTPEQQSLVDQLKKQIAQLQAGSQKVTEGATKAVGDLLKK
jgi:hypothetical protein